MEKALKNLNITKGAGSDGIQPIFWKKCAKTLASPIATIFNISLQKSEFPSCWKMAHIVPIHKKGSRNNVENYRGISILSTIAKVFEKLVFNDIYPVIRAGIPLTQHGFLKNRSTVTNLALFSNYVLSNIDNGGQVDVIYTDFEKAFDRVDHVILLTKLFKLGIRGDLLRWVQSYLTRRSQAVVVGGYRSNFVMIPTGVPQGSHFGPLFYNAYLFDIGQCFKFAKHLLYADDKKVYCKISRVEECFALQRDLNSLSQYYIQNKININVRKCQSICFTRKRNPIQHTYSFNGVTIDKTSVIRDLGVLFDEKLLFTEHIDMISTKAFKNLGFILRTCKNFKNVDAIKSVYFAYTRSILEYACSIWSPQYIIHKSRLEKIQQKFVNYLNYQLRKPKISYEHSCKTYGLLTLEDRRKLLDMSLLYDILNSHIDSPELLQSVEFNLPSRRTRHTPMLHIPAHSSNYASNSVLTRIARTHNTYFGDIDIFHQSKRVFKSNIIQKCFKSD